MMQALSKEGDKHIQIEIIELTNKSSGSSSIYSLLKHRTRAATACSSLKTLYAANIPSWE